MNISLLALAMTVTQAPVNLPPPVFPPAPFVFVTITGPKGTEVTYQPGSAKAISTAEPVGLRPGYPYRVELSKLPEVKNRSLYPSIDVRGVLTQRPGFDVMKYPVSIVFTEQDIEKVIDGKMITKVYYLENPNKALAATGSSKEPLEFAASSEEEAINEARDRGRPMLIVRLGERAFSKEELLQENVPGTVYVPSAKVMPVAACAPLFPIYVHQPYDPILGPKGTDAECLFDGGDTGERMGVGPDGKLRGVNPSDTGMQFTTSKGTRVTASNRVALCVPRYVAARVEAGTAGHQAVQTPEIGSHVRLVAGFGGKSGITQANAREQVAGLASGQRASGMESRQSASGVEQWSGRPKGLANVQGTTVAAQITGPDEISTSPSTQFMIAKSVDPPNADQIGQEVTFYLRFSNPTNEVMTGVVIADSLTARLEYVEGTSKTSRPATFTNTTNEAGSSMLKWVIDGKLMPGEFGVISFKAKIR